MRGVAPCAATMVTRRSSAPLAVVSPLMLSPVSSSARQAGGNLDDLQQDPVLLALRSLEHNVDLLASDVSMHNIRMLRLEKNLMDKQGTIVSSSPTNSRPPGPQDLRDDDVWKRFDEQRDEISSLKGQLSQLEARLAGQPTPAHGAGENGVVDLGSPSAVTLEEQLRELVGELRKLQQEQHHFQEHQRMLNATSSAADTTDVASLLTELSEERGRVTDMLDGVRQQKLEVIAMMHTFAVGKDDAVQELETLRSTAKEEIQGEIHRLRSFGGLPFPQENPTYSSGTVDVYTPELVDEAPGPRRNTSSHNNLQMGALTAGPVGASLAATATQQAQQQQQQQMLGTAQQVWGRPPPQVDSLRSVGGNCCSVGCTNMCGNNCAVSPSNAVTSAMACVSRQISACMADARGPCRSPHSPVYVASAAPVPQAQGAATGLAMSPMLRTRSTACDIRNASSPHGAVDVKRASAAVRRFVSAGGPAPSGLSPRAVESRQTLAGEAQFMTLSHPTPRGDGQFIALSQRTPRGGSVCTGGYVSMPTIGFGSGRR